MMFDKVDSAEAVSASSMGRSTRPLTTIGAMMDIHFLAPLRSLVKMLD
jgi:hypothetical protein